MPSELRSWQELPVAGVVQPRPDVRPRTGTYRTGVRPEVRSELCVDCLLCWIYCPDTAVLLDGTAFAGIDLDHCKGCEICAEVCPTGAIEMVAESRRLDGGAPVTEVPALPAPEWKS